MAKVLQRTLTFREEDEERPQVFYDDTPADVTAEYEKTVIDFLRIQRLLTAQRAAAAAALANERSKPADTVSKRNKKEKKKKQGRPRGGICKTTVFRPTKKISILYHGRMETSRLFRYYLQSPQQPQQGGGVKHGTAGGTAVGTASGTVVAPTAHVAPTTNEPSSLRSSLRPLTLTQAECERIRQTAFKRPPLPPLSSASPSPVSPRAKLPLTQPTTTTTTTTTAQNAQNAQNCSGAASPAQNGVVISAEVQSPVTVSLQNLFTALDMPRAARALPWDEEAVILAYNCFMRWMPRIRKKDRMMRTFDVNDLDPPAHAWVYFYTCLQAAARYIDDIPHTLTAYARLVDTAPRELAQLDWEMYHTIGFRMSIAPSEFAEWHEAFLRAFTNRPYGFVVPADSITRVHKR